MMNIGEFRKFCSDAHEELDQKYGEEHYIYHLDAVASELNSWHPCVIKAAYGHDLLEDSCVTFEQLVSMIGVDAATIVAHVTNPEGETREIRTKVLNKRLSILDENSFVGLNSLLLKIADRSANMKHSIKTGSKKHLYIYVKEHQEFMNATYRKDNTAIKEACMKLNEIAKQALKRFNEINGVDND